MITIVENIINNAQDRFKDWVNLYNPWVGPNHTTERNLSFQFATAFLDLYKSGFAFMEVPFAIHPSTYNRNHLDAYLHSDNFDLLLECKNIYAPSHIKMITSDIERMSTGLIGQIHKRHSVKPGKTHGVVFAETWYPDISDWWTNKYSGNRKAWKDSNLKLPDGWIYKSVLVDKFNDEPDGTLFWLYGVSDKF